MSKYIRDNVSGRELDPHAAHVDAERMEICMGLLNDLQEITFRHNAETFGFDHNDIEYMRGVVSRSRPCNAARNNAHYYQLLVAERQRQGYVAMTECHLAYQYILNDAIAGDMVKSCDVYRLEILMRDGSWLQLVEASHLPHGFYVKTQDKLA